VIGFLIEVAHDASQVDGDRESDITYIGIHCRFARVFGKVKIMKMVVDIDRWVSGDGLVYFERYIHPEAAHQTAVVIQRVYQDSWLQPLTDEQKQVFSAAYSMAVTRVNDKIRKSGGNEEESTLALFPDVTELLTHLGHPMDTQDLRLAGMVLFNEEIPEVEFSDYFTSYIINEDQFLSLMRWALCKPNSDDLRTAFRLFDRNSDGRIDVDEFMAFFNSVDQLLNDGPDDTDLYPLVPEIWTEMRAMLAPIDNDRTSFSLDQRGDLVAHDCMSELQFHQLMTLNRIPAKTPAANTGMTCDVTF